MNTKQDKSLFSQTQSYKYKVWDVRETSILLYNKLDKATIKKTERMIFTIFKNTKPLKLTEVFDENNNKPIQNIYEFEIEEAKKKRKKIFICQLIDYNHDFKILFINDLRQSIKWVWINKNDLLFTTIKQILINITNLENRQILLIPHSKINKYFRKENFDELFYFKNEKVNLDISKRFFKDRRFKLNASNNKKILISDKNKLDHLEQLEAESIFILREAISISKNPVMLYSIGKDSSVMLHLARKAFLPKNCPFPLLHVDTLWKFRQMYEFRQEITKKFQFELIRYTNPEGREKNITPLNDPTAHTMIMKTEALKKALDKYGFDMAFGGARRDEEKSRAKERVFSFRSQTHSWDPQNQRPELWKIFNGRINKGESVRVFPLSNWTELDIWQYIEREKIPVVPLYFSSTRPIIERDGNLIMVDDDRIKIMKNEKIKYKKIRFRSLGCYPLSSPILSNAKNVRQIIRELKLSKNSERQGRIIDKDHISSMEMKKLEGYF